MRSPDRPIGYGGRPVLKPPVWTWEVPLYFFLGGAAGASAVIAAAALASGGEPALARAALWVAALGGAVSPGLLTSDLGRPARALNMFRVFKPRSPMSVGSWTLLLFGTASAAALLLHEGLELRAPALAAAVLAALSGLVLATYTGVLVAVSVIPVWRAHARLLPAYAGATALGSAAGLLVLLVPDALAMRRLLLLAALAECAAGVVVELDRGQASGPLHHGRSGALLRMGGTLAGPIPAAALLFLPASRWAQTLAASAFVLGGLLLRYGWIAAGRASAADPSAPLA
jgi:hypothetical protein